MLLSDKVDFRAKKFTKDRQKDYIIINGSIHQKDTAILNVYTSNNNAAKYVKQKLIKLQGETDKSIITVKRLQLSTLSNQTVNQQGEKNSAPLSNRI